MLTPEEQAAVVRAEDCLPCTDAYMLAACIRRLEAELKRRPPVAVTSIPVVARIRSDLSDRVTEAMEDVP